MLKQSLCRRCRAVPSIVGGNAFLKDSRLHTNLVVEVITLQQVYVNVLYVFFLDTGVHRCL